MQSLVIIWATIGLIVCIHRWFLAEKSKFLLADIVGCFVNIVLWPITLMDTIGVLRYRRYRRIENEKSDNNISDDDS